MSNLATFREAGRVGSGPNFSTWLRVGSGRVRDPAGRVGSGQKKVTHGQLCSGHTKLVKTEQSEAFNYLDDSSKILDCLIYTNVAVTFLKYNTDLPSSGYSVSVDKLIPRRNKL